MKQTDMNRTARAGGYAVQTAGLTKRFGGRCVSAAPFMAPVFVNAPGVSAHAGSRSRRGSL
jgi:hypothetical protein